MSAAANIPLGSDGRRYEAVLRLSEALSLCREPEDLTRILSEQLREFLDFLQFYIIVYKENSVQVEWAVLGQERNLIAVYADVPVQERPSWRAYTTQEPFHIRDWNSDERVSARLKQNLADQGIKQGPLVFVPLTTPHRRLGALGVSGDAGVAYSSDDISFLRLIGRVVAFAIDDNFNLKRAQAAKAELQRQNERLQRSERELREVIETIPAMAWSASADGAAEFFNGRWLAYAGLTADQAQGWGWTVAVHPDDLTVLVDYWRTVMASGQSGEIEARLRRFDGVHRWFLFRATPSLDDKGRVVKWYGTNTDIEERKRAEEALRRSEAYLAEAQRLTLTGSCAIDGTSRQTLYWSEEMFRLFGFDPQQGLPMWDQWLQRVHPEDRDKFKLAGDRTFLEKVDCDVEFRLVKPDGTIKHIHAIGHPVVSPNGELVQVVGTMVDVSERKHAEEGLRRSEKELRDVIETIPSMVWTALPDGSNAFVNKRWTEYTRLSAAEAAGSGWQSAMHPDDVQQHVDKWLVSLATGKPLEDECRFRRAADGEYRWMLVRGLALRDEHGDILRWYGTLTDIEERKRAEEALKRSEAYLAEAQRLSRTGSWTYSPVAQKALYWSDEMFRIHEFDPQQGPPTSEAFLKRVHPEDREIVDRAMRNAARERTEYLVEHRIILASGMIRHIHAIGHPIPDRSGNVEFVGVAMDVTASKEAEHEHERLRQELAHLAHLNRVSTLGELSASLAHEIKQPIGAAVTNAEACVRLLNRDQPNLPEAREAALEMVKDARRAADIIDRVRSLYHKGSSQLETIEINEVIGDMVVLLQDEASRHSFRIRTDLAERLPVVMADRVQLQQVLLNLMLNGIEAMRDASSELSIKSQLADDGQLLISVTDTGVGLPTENTEEIFEAFFTTKPHGTGLGLAITRSIVEAHGGRIWAAANSGGGATFCFTLPSRVAVAA